MVEAGANPPRFHLEPPEKNNAIETRRVSQVLGTACVISV